jgi:hypothetical protein
VKNFTITNEDNTKMSVDIVRYFKYKNDCYLIYTMNEVDEKGYLKLYLVKVMEELGFPVVYNIRDDKEWASMQGIVKKVLKEIKSNKKKLLVDLDYSGIQGIKVANPRSFKLDQKLAKILSNHYDFSNINDQIVSENSTNDGNLNEIPVESESVPQTTEIPSENNLESIDETLLKQGAFDPILADGVIESDNNEPDNSTSTEPATIENHDLVTNSVEINENTNLDETEQIEESASNPVDESEHEVELSNSDYKELYLAEKKEREAVELVLDDLLEQLQQYKDKFGNI